MDPKKGESADTRSDPMTAQLTLNAADIPFATSGLDTPTFFVDIIRGTQVAGDVAKISLVEHRMNAQSDTIEAVHVARIVVPTKQIRSWGMYFTKLADQLGLPDSEGGPDGQ